MRADHASVRNGQGADYEARGRKAGEKFAGQADVQNAVERAHLMEMNVLGPLLMHDGFGLRQQRKGGGREVLRLLAKAA